MAIHRDQVIQLLQKKTADYGKIIKSEIERSGESVENFNPPKKLFISEKELFDELGAKSFDDKETVRQCASSFIDSANAGAEESGIDALIINTDISLEEMAKAKAFREQMEQPDNTSSGCFIATATYGSPLSIEVQVLRKFRDELLIISKLGANLVKLYYWFSPSIADKIHQSSILKSVFRILLYPIISFVKAVLYIKGNIK